MAELLLFSALDMDVTLSVLSSLIVLVLGATSARADIEYVSPEQRDQLESQFQKASFDAAADGRKLEERKWSCDMFGARSRMQAQHGLKLYSMARKAGGEWQNSGAQLVSQYKVDSNALTGHKDRFEDQVKFTKEGLLVSRLSLNDQAKTVIAYSVCKTL